MRDRLKRQGFKSSHFNPCLFIQHDMILVSYVDDMIAVAYGIQTIGKGLLLKILRDAQLTKDDFIKLL